MTLTDDEATRLLDRLADRVPDEPVPVGDLLAGGRRAARRRRRVSVAAGITAGVLLAGSASVAAVVMERSGDGSDRVVDRPSTITPPKGTYYVGLRGVVIAVPTDWPVVDLVCNPQSAPFVAFSRLHPITISCLNQPSSGGGHARLSSVAIGNHEILPDGPPPGEVRCSSAIECTATVQVAAADVVFGILLHQDGARAAIQAMVASVRSLPDGFSTVPYVDSERSIQPRLADVRAALEQAGLDVVVKGHVTPDSTVSSEDPRVGTVVAGGATVTVTVGG